MAEPGGTRVRPPGLSAPAVPVAQPRSQLWFLWQDFVVGLSVLLRGTVHQKLKWAFNLYDINKDGYITKEVTGGAGGQQLGGVGRVGALQGIPRGGWRRWKQVLGGKGTLVQKVPVTLTPPLSHPRKCWRS